MRLNPLKSGSQIELKIEAMSDRQIIGLNPLKSGSQIELKNDEFANDLLKS